VSLEEFIPEDHFCRVIDAFVDRLDVQGLDLREQKRPRRGDRDTIRGIC